MERENTNVKNRNISEKILCVLLILVMLMSSIYFPRGKAEEVTAEETTQAVPTPIPSGVDKITAENCSNYEYEKAKLLGVSNLNTVRRENPLGIAKEFSIFAKEDVTFTGADVEGSVAAGGAIKATTDYEFQIGWKNKNNEKADLVVGDGPVENIALTFGADGEGNEIEDNKKVVVSTDATNMNYDEYENDEEKLEKFVACDLIDFDKEFEYFEKLSNYIESKGSYYWYSTQSNQTVNLYESAIYDGSKNMLWGYNYVYSDNRSENKLYYLKGTNEKLNIFKLPTVSQGAIVLDVPVGSYAIITVEAEGKSDCDFSNMGGIFYPLSKEQLSQSDATKDELAYVSINPKGDGEPYYVKDENGDFRVFKELSNGINNNNEPDELSKYILFNLPNATEIFMQNVPGSILAPKADVNGGNSYMPGTLICKSYTGNTQFGTVPYDGPITNEEKYTIDVNKIDSITKEQVKDAQLEILNMNRESLYSWKSGEEINIELEPGEYILVEKSAGASYEQVVNRESTFTVSGSVKEEQDGKFASSAYISMGAETTETVLEKHSVDWNFPQYEFKEDTGVGVDQYNSLGSVDTLYLDNGNKVVLSNIAGASTDEYVVTEYNESGAIINSYSGFGAKLTEIINGEIIENGYRFVIKSSDLFEIICNTQESKITINNMPTLNTGAIWGPLGLTESKTCRTLDNGAIITGYKYNVKDFTIPASMTVDGNEIKSPYGDMEEKTIIVTMKVNSESKIEWANFMASETNVSFSGVVEISDGYILYGGLQGKSLNIEKTQNAINKNINIYDIDAPIGIQKPLLLKINKKGEVCYYNYIDYNTTQDKYGGVYKYFESIKIVKDKIYGYISGKIVCFEKTNFPIDWENLYAGVDMKDKPIFTNISFEVDSSKATTLTNKNLYVTVAANNEVSEFDGRTWTEFLTWTEVKEGQQIESCVPAFEEFYPLDTSLDWNLNGKLEPHFYRQNLEDPNDTATEVFDIEVKNIKAIYYTATEETKTYTSQDYVTTSENADSIIIENDHIKNTIKIVKTDLDTGAPVPGATYGIYDSQDAETPILMSVTDANGVIEFKDVLLDVGKYYVKETKAPEGYKLSLEVKELEITKSDNHLIEVKDDKIIVLVEKVDQDNKYLPGAVLKVENEKGEEVSKWTTTDSAKEIEGLSAGTYKLTETYTPTGYVKGKDITFTITDTGEIYIDGTKVEKVTLTNTLVKGTINITKTGEVFSKLTLAEREELYTKYKANYDKVSLSDVTFELYAQEDIIENGRTIYTKEQKITEATTDKFGIATFDNLPLGNYYVVEKTAKEGYILDKTPIILGLAYADENTPIIYAAETMNNERVKAEIEIEKVKKGTTEEGQISAQKLEGAVFGLYNSEDLYNQIPKDTLLSTAITGSDGLGKFDIDLPLGKYYVKELEAPAGYIKSDERKEINFTVSENTSAEDVLNEQGEVEKKKYKLIFENDYTKIEISKTEINTDTQIIGATLELVDSQGNVVGSPWVTDGKTHCFDTLPAGKYTIRETSPAPGYVTAEDKEIIVEAIPGIQSFNMEDDFTKVEISKIELVKQDKIEVDGSLEENKDKFEVNSSLEESQDKVEADDSSEEEQETMEQNEVKYVVGATLQLFDEQGNAVLDSDGNAYIWETEEQPKLITKLPIGTYVLKEVKTPAGYVTSPDITITITDTPDVHKVTMEDDFTKVEFSKIDKETKELISGVTLQILDEQNNPVKNEEGVPYKWITTTSTKVINKLPVGKYKLVEVEPKTGYIKAEDVSFEVTESGETVQVIMEDDFTKLEIEKVDDSANPVHGAILQILDENGNVIDEWETNGTVHEINKKLEVGKTYTLVESEVPEGYVKAEDIEFTVLESGKIVINEANVEDSPKKDSTVEDTKNVNNTVENEQNSNGTDNNEQKGNNEADKIETVEKITMVNKFVTGTIKITKTGEVLKGVTKYKQQIPGFEQLESYKFEYEDGALSGVVFELYAAEDIILNGVTKYTKDQKIAEATTDENGLATFENMNIGSYYFVEKQTQEGYEADKTPVTLVLAYEKENDNEDIISPLVYVTTFNNERIKSNIKVNKIDKTTKESLEKVVFGLYTKDEINKLPADTLLSIVETNSKGKANFDIDVPLGKYYVKELKANDGYILSNEKQEIDFTSTKNSNVDKNTNNSVVTYELTFENDYTKVKIRKINEDNQYIKGAQLQIQDMEGKVVEQWITTDSHHTIERKLLAGKTYKLVEVKAPQGYNVAKPIEFTVNTDGKINDIKMVDTEKLSTDIPQTGDYIDIAFIVVLLATAVVAGYNCVKYVRLRKED